MTRIKLKFASGLRLSKFLSDVLWVVADRFSFEEADDAEFLIFGPYGPPPAKNDGVRDAVLFYKTAGLPLLFYVPDHGFPVRWGAFGAAMIVTKREPTLQKSAAKLLFRK